MLLPKPKYNIINAMLQKENLDTMEVGELVGEIRAHEMGILGMSEEPTSSKSIALKTKVDKHCKLKIIKQESSLSDKEDNHQESTSDDEDDGGELALMMRKFTHLSDKINNRAYNFDPKRKMFQPRGDSKSKTCYNCGEKGHISPDCPKPDKRKKDNKSKHRHDSSDDEEEGRTKTRNLGRKRAMTRRPSSSQKRKGTPREASWWKNKNG